MKSAPSGPPVSVPHNPGWGREVMLLLGMVLLLLWMLALASHALDDPGWSDTGSGGAVANRMGRAGAWLADVCYFHFGLSVWWLPLLFARLGLLHLMRCAARPPVSAQGLLRAFGRFWGGLILLLASSCLLEWEHLHRLDARLPGLAGGGLGQMLGQWAVPWLGHVGTALLAMALWLVALGWSWGFSWVRLADRIGGWLEMLLPLVRRRAQVSPAAGGQRARRNKARWQPDGAGQQPDRGEQAGPVEPVLDAAAVPGQGTLEGNSAGPSCLPPPTGPQEDGLPGVLQGVLPGVPPDAVDPGWLPPLDLLDAADGPSPRAAPDEDLKLAGQHIENCFRNYGLSVEVVRAVPGPVVTRYDIEPGQGIKGSQVLALGKDLARCLGMKSVRMLDVVPGTRCLGLELPNSERQAIGLRSVLQTPAWQQGQAALPLGLGLDTEGQAVVVDLATMPHLMVAGTTGSGKSVGLHAMILSLLYRLPPRALRFVFIDPKMLELSRYEGLAHLLCPVLTDVCEAKHALAWCVQEMARRYQLMKACGAGNLGEYHQMQQGRDTPHLPRIVVVIDELADLMMEAGKSMETQIARLAQMARAAGIHLILATQRPSADVISGLLKANIPARIAFAVSSRVNSQIILDQGGAETLLGAGDMLYRSAATGLVQRVHGAFVSGEEVRRVLTQLRAMHGAPHYADGVLQAAAEAADET